MFDDHVNFYIIMELMTGGELYDLIMKSGRLNERQSASVIKQCLLAVAYMHEQNILHRDIKPENILIKGNDNELIVKLTDFGLASKFTRGKKLKEALCTPLYASPEIVMGEDYNQKIDIWGIGIVVYLMLVGSPPFNGDSQEEINKSILKCEPTFGRVKGKLSSSAVDFIN